MSNHSAPSRDLKTSITLMHQSRELCVQLQECLSNERRALIELRMEDMMQNNIRKQSLLSELLNSKKNLEAMLERSFGTTSLDQVSDALSEENRLEWSSVVEDWKAEWERTRDKCQMNQQFIRHSLKNLNLFAEHFRRLLGVNSVYSKQGREVELQTEGHVLKAEY